MDGQMDGWVGGWMGGSKSQFRDSLQQSKMVIHQDRTMFSKTDNKKAVVKLLVILK